MRRVTQNFILKQVILITFKCAEKSNDKDMTNIYVLFCLVVTKMLTIMQKYKCLQWI